MSELFIVKSSLENKNDPKEEQELDEIYVTGANSHGQLGIGNQIKTNIPIRIRVRARVLKVACGAGHSALLTVEGKVYTWGSNRWGQLGTGNTKNFDKPVLIQSLSQIQDISCGNQHTFAVGSKDCFSWGCGCHGQLGIGVVDVPQTKPTVVSKLTSLGCRQVSCGGLHTAVLTKDGRVFAFGWGRSGQIGQKANVLHEDPMHVPLGEAAIKVSCGWNHTLALTASARCYAWGAGTHGQTASPSRQHRRQPRVIVFREPDEALANRRGSNSTADESDAGQLIGDIACGARISQMLTTDGHLWACGLAEDGALGAGKEVVRYQGGNGCGPPIPIPVAAGRHPSISETQAKQFINANPSDMDLIEADTSVEDNPAAPAETRKNVRFARVCCGAWHTVALDEHGAVFVWGLGADGRLGLGDTLNRVVPAPLTALSHIKVDSVDAGAAHTVFVNKRHTSSPPPPINEN